VLHYCKELDVALEVYVMETMANLFQSDNAFGGSATVRRRIANDMQGYISEMLAKAVNQKRSHAELDATTAITSFVSKKLRRPRPERNL